MNKHILEYSIEINTPNMEFGIRPLNFNNAEHIIVYDDTKLLAIWSDGVVIQYESFPNVKKTKVFSNSPLSLDEDFPSDRPELVIS
ncbi:hypothetical protein [Ruoffia tabacinasalis]|uniref:Uncharacterized protein n=1 Tax=Ruoffia tabacinasalis TaxID=87458 RepID=A0ABS0LI34_9LACT|nr:hypothetical protein [Ruoffia tabacinasalis]MBG9977260.1 hypothetical protein [Ruoffia tabacinasalis]